MNSKITLLLSNLNEQISFIDLEIDDTIHKCEKAIEIILISNNTLKKIITKNNFKSEQEEILFFKEIKPNFTSKLIYFNRELDRPISKQWNCDECGNMELVKSIILKRKSFKHLN